MATKIPAMKTTLTRQPKVYSYVRISTAYKQAKGRGVKRQGNGAVDWCDRHGYTLEITNTFTDKGMSALHGKNAECGELRVILSLIESGKIQRNDILLIESLDRLSRNKINLAVQLLLQIINAGVKVVTLIDNATYTDDANPHELMASLIMPVAIFMRANDESRTKSLRKGDSWKSKRELAMKGEYHGGNVPRWIEVVGGKYRVIESEAGRVRSIFADYVAGLGLYRLKEKYGVPSPTIGYWLTNPVVIGTLVVKEGDQKVSITDHYPAIITNSVFEMAQRRRAERYVKRRAGRVDKYVNLFAGLLVDPNGERMIICQHNGGTRNYTSKGCVIRVRYLEEVVCFWTLPGRFVRVKAVEQSQPDDPKRLAKVESDMKQIQATMMEEPSLAAGLLPVLRKLQALKTELVGKSQTVSEKVDMTLILNLLNDEVNPESRHRLRELANQTIKSLNVTKIESDNWHTMVSGVVTTTDGVKHPFRYAYNTRRDGFIMTDRDQVVVNDDGEDARNIIATTVDDRVKAELKKHPLRVKG